MIKYIPALKYAWLTPYFDLFMQRAMPESQFKNALIIQADIGPEHRVLDFGVGTATLSSLAKQLVPQSEITGIDIDEKISASPERRSKQRRRRSALTTV